MFANFQLKTKAFADNDLQKLSLVFHRGFVVRKPLTKRLPPNKQPTTDN